MDPYKNAGVDIQEGEEFVNDISSLISSTHSNAVLHLPNGFAGLYELPKYKNPVLVSSTDGVGTKVSLARQFNNYKGLGQDLVAMCVNDLGCIGAKPLFFLDYLASSKLNRKILGEVVAGIANACKQVGAALLGGETAEMPGVYQAEEIDCAGFTVGIVEKEKIIDGKTITAGDQVIGVASSGFHSNGFSLIRKILEETSPDLEMICPETERSLKETLMIPTKLYTPLIQNLMDSCCKLKGIAHITGGGLEQNPPRILPKGRSISWKKESWPVPSFMQLFKEKGKLSDSDFLRVFNAGIGLVLVVSAPSHEKVLEQIHTFGEKAWTIGEVE